MHRWFKTNQSSLVFSALLCLLVFLLMFGCVVGPKTEEHKQPVIIGHVKQHKQPVVGHLVASNGTNTSPSHYNKTATHHSTNNTSVPPSKSKKTSQPAHTYNPYKAAKRIFKKKPDAAAYILNKSNTPLVCQQTLTPKGQGPARRIKIWLDPKDHRAIFYVRITNETEAKRANITAYYVVDVFNRCANCTSQVVVKHYLYLNNTFLPILPLIYNGLMNQSNSTFTWNQTLGDAVRNTSCTAITLPLTWFHSINMAVCLNGSALNEEIILHALLVCGINPQNTTANETMSCPYAGISYSFIGILSGHEADLYPTPAALSSHNQVCHTLNFGNQSIEVCSQCTPTDNLPTLPKTKPCSPIQYLTYVAQNLNQSKSSH